MSARVDLSLHISDDDVSSRMPDLTLEAFKTHIGQLSNCPRPMHQPPYAVHGKREMQKVVRVRRCHAMHANKMHQVTVD